MRSTNQIIREDRTRVHGEVICFYSDGEAFGGQWLDVSRTGASLRLGRYLMPGRALRLVFTSPLDAEAPVELEARVIWCRPIKGAYDFALGLHIRRDCPDAAVAFAALGYQQRAVMGQMAHGQVAGGLWPHFRPLDLSEQGRLNAVGLPGMV